MGVLETLSPVVEPVSIDEAYLDVTGMEGLMGPPDGSSSHGTSALRHNDMK